MKRPIIRKNDKIYGDVSATFSYDGEDVAIITGAGGDGKCLRYFFIVSSADGESFSIDQKRLISQIFAKIAKISDTKIENNNFHNQYILTSVLIPITIAIGDFIEHCIKACNQKKELLKFHYFVTNTHKPSKEEIEQYLEEFEN